MQPILDKDFDKLFRDKLNEIEVEPSAGVWSGISAQLNGKKKKPFPVLWLAAACLATVIAFGLLMVPEKESIKLTGSPDLPKQNTEPAPAPVISVAEPVKKSFGKAKGAEKFVADQPKSTMVKSEEPRVLASSKTIDRAIEPEQKVRSLKVEPVINTSEVVKPATDLPVIANAVIEDHNTEIVDDGGGEIKNSKSVVSSVVNFVVGKVDKRKDKIIELEHNDEGTKVKSMNLILLKFKSKN